MARALLATVALFAGVSAVELTKDTWDAAVSDSQTILIADVDCTAAGKEKCNEVGVRGYPTIKYGDPEDLQDYKGGRKMADLKTFAEGLGPQCGPANLDLCEADKKAKIEEFQKLSADAREKLIKEKEAEMEKAETDFKEFVEGLQKKYQESSDNKDKAVEAIKADGLGLLKAVHAFQKKQKSEL